MEKEVKSLEYTITVVVNRDGLSAGQYAAARNRIEKFVADGLNQLTTFLMIDPEMPNEALDLAEHIDYCYVSKACLEQTYGDR